MDKKRKLNREEEQTDDIDTVYVRDLLAKSALTQTLKIQTFFTRYRRERTVRSAPKY